MDKFLRIVIICASLLCFFSCENVNKKVDNKLSKKEYKYASMKDGVLHLDLNEARKHPRDIMLSEICDSLIYIPLETNKECLINRSFPEIVKDGDDIFIDYSWGLYHFNIKGEFVCQIGKIGRGPDEYVCTNFCISKKDKRIYAVANYKRRILQFDYSGKLLNDNVRINDIPCDFEYDELNDYIISSHDYELQTRGSLDSLQYDVFKIRNLKGEISHVHKSKTFPKEDIKKGSMSVCIKGANIHKYKSSFYIQELSNDTIFRINNSQLEPKYILNNKIYKQKMNFKNYMNVVKNRKDNSYARNLFYNRIIGESERYIILGNSEHFIYDKRERKLEMFRNGIKAHGGFNNDLDQIIKGSPQFVLNEKYLLFTVSAVDVIERNTKYTECTGDKHVNKYTKYVENLSCKISEEDNPVLVLARLKN